MKRSTSTHVQLIFVGAQYDEAASRAPGRLVVRSVPVADPGDLISRLPGPKTLAWVTAVAAEPQVDLSGLTVAAEALWPRAGAIAGAASRNNPAPAPTATCAARTSLTGTAALRW